MVKAVDNLSTNISLKTSESFISPTDGKVSFSSVVGRVVRYIESRPEFKYRLIVGSDSETNDQRVDYVTAIVVHRVGAGGIYFWQKNIGQKCHTLRERIYNEALLSLDSARKLLTAFHVQKVLDLDLEIHVDVGTNGETREIINEMIGMVRSSGFSVKTKPDSFGASKVADRHT